MRCGSVSSRPGTGFEVKAVPQDDFLAFPILSTTLFLAPEATTVRLLLEHGASTATPGPGGLTPLHFGVMRSGVDIVRLLLEHGADPSAKNEE